MNKIHIQHSDGDLYFDEFKRAEILLVNNNKTKEIFVNLESICLDSNQILEIEKNKGIKINKDILFAIPKIQITNLNQSEFDNIFKNQISIKKGWENELKSCGVYVGWGIETFDNIIELKYINDSVINMKWNCITDDLNYYDDRAKKKPAIFEANLNVHRFLNKQEFWDYERDKMNGIK